MTIAKTISFLRFLPATVVLVLAFPAGCTDEPAAPAPDPGPAADAAPGGPGPSHAPDAGQRSNERLFDAGISDTSVAVDALSPSPMGPPPDAGSTAGLQVPGTWKGETSQLLPITFIFDQVGLQQVELAWQLPGCSGTTKTTFERPLPVTNGAFTHVLVGGPGGVSGTVTGQFSSPRELRGNISLTAVPIPGVPSCASSGTATYAARPEN
jgi:hypothetical protein